jgi:DNA polymerase
MLVGEAPGADEVKQGRPFCGRAGKLLDKNLQAIGVDRDTLLVANVFRNRPPDNKVGEFFASRKKAAAAGEILDESLGKFGAEYVLARWRSEIDHLLQTIEQLQPRAVVALGRVPMWALTGQNGLTALRGQKLAVRGSTVPVIATYHPSYLARLINMDPNAEPTFQADILAARAL